MADELTADLELSIADALASVDDLRGALVDAIESSVDGVPPLEIEPDVSSVTPAIDDAVSAADGTVPVEADGAEQLTFDLDAAVGAADGGVPVEATGTEVITTEIGAAVDAVDATVVVEADTTEAVGAIDDLGSSASGAGDSLSGLADVQTAAGASAGVATGSFAGLGSAVGGMSKEAAIGVGSVLALAAASKQMFTAAVENQGALFRLQQTFGTFASSIETIRVGSLNMDLQDLALKLGSDDENMRNAASTAGILAQSFGRSKAESADFAAQLLAVASRGVALNPALGDAGSAAERLLKALQSGRERALIPFQLGLTKVQIESKAMEIAIADGRSEVTMADKAFAGVSLAVDKFGSSLNKNITEGAKNPTLTLASLRQKVQELIEDAGQPLTVPIFQIMEDALPIVKSVSTVVSELAVAALPILHAALVAAVPFIQAFADGLHAIPPEVLTVIAVLGGIALVASRVITAMKLMNTAMLIGAAPQPWMLVALAIGGVVSALGLLSGGSDEAAAASKGLTDAIVEQNGVLDENSRKMILASLSADNQKDDLKRAGVVFSEYTDAVQSAGGANDKARDRLEKLAEAFRLGADGNALFTDKLHEADSSLGDITSDADRAAASNQAFVNVMKAASPELGRLAEKLVVTGEANDGLKRKLVDQAIAMANATSETKLNAAIQTTEAAAVDYSKERTDAKKAALDAHKQATFEAMDATQRNALVTQAAADADALAVQQSKAAALSARDHADGQAALAVEVTASADSFAAAQDAAIRYAFGIGTAAELTDAMTRAEQALRSELDLVFGRFLDADQATNRFKQAQLDLGATLLGNGYAFDQQSKAGLDNRNALDDLGNQAQTTAIAILHSSNDVNQARQPLIDFRAQVQTLRDDLAAAGKDTSFVDGILANTDNAIAGVTAKEPDAETAGKDLGGALDRGVRSMGDVLRESGKAIGEGAAKGAESTKPQHESTGLGLAGALGSGVLGGAPDVFSAGIATAAGSARGADTTRGQHAATGVGLGAALGSGIGATAGAAASSGASVAAAGVAAAAGFYWQYYGAGASSAQGVADGVMSVAGAVAAAGAAIGRAGTEAIHAWIDNPPFPSRVGIELGRSLGTGFAVGIDRSASDVTASTGHTMEQALAALRSNARGGGGAPMVFNIEVHGVSDPAVGRNVGEQIGAGAVDALARRGYVVTARLG